MTWQKGKEAVSGQLDRGELEKVTADENMAAAWLAKARNHLRSADLIAETDPEGAYAMAHDAIRSAFSAVLQQQGLRGTVKGGHRAPQEAVYAQLGAAAGAAFDPANRIRVRRNEVEYPAAITDVVSADDVTYAVTSATTIVDMCEQAVPLLTVFAD